MAAVACENWLGNWPALSPSWQRHSDSPSFPRFVELPVCYPSRAAAVPLQGRQEFVGPASALPAHARQSSDADAAAAQRGQQVASFYSSLVQTSGSRWVSGGTLNDPTDGTTIHPAAGPDQRAAAADGSAASAAQAGGDAAHAGLGSAAARAELASEQVLLQYTRPAGPELPNAVTVLAPAAAGNRGEQPPPQQQQQPQRWGPREGVRYGIARSNVGFRLLKKAGWAEGSGLGAQEQGVAEPIAAFEQRGNLGLGYAPKPKPGQVPAATAATAAARDAAQRQQQAAQQPPQPKRPLPEDPLDKEDTQTKVKRVKQVRICHAESSQHHGLGCVT
jgi:hypothetical protein